VLAGLTITGGSAFQGGGIYCYESSPTIINDIISGNSANGGGGGMYSREDSHPTVTNCTFSENSATNGGGMYNGDQSRPPITNCTFSNNSATEGGGLYNYTSSPTLTNCTFSGNSASKGGGMLHSSGPSSSPLLINCTFTQNTAVWGGGGMHNWWGLPTVINCTFTQNTAYWGGGMYSQGNSLPTVSNCTFSENSATHSGGGMYNYLIDPTVTNCTFSGNSATEGGGLYNYNSSPTVSNCTFSENSAIDSGGGMYNISGSPMVTNCILWGDSPDEISGGGIPIVTYSNIEGSWTGDGNIDADPRFVDPDSSDYHLSSESPCVDAGTDAGVYDDFEGDPRPQGNGYDIGYDESPYSINYNLTLTPSGPTTIQGGDTFYFRTLFQNHMGSPIAGDYWISILLPNLNEILIPEGLLNYPNPLSGQVPSGSALQLDNELSVPGGAPVGSYSLIGRIGVHPNTVIDADTLDIEVVE
jgi:parallel beta-helix repeat protein/predicted outer membrane repeat protein